MDWVGPCRFVLRILRFDVLRVEMCALVRFESGRLELFWYENSTDRSFKVRDEQIGSGRFGAN